MDGEKQGLGEHPFEVTDQGNHEYLVHVHGSAEDAESWVRVSPGVLSELGVAATDEADVVERTIAFLLRHQGPADFPAIVELEDVLSAYPDFPGALAE